VSPCSITHNRHPEGGKAEHDNASTTSPDSVYNGVYGQISIFPKEEGGKNPQKGKNRSVCFEREVCCF
jgi:hypothetical protein